MYLQKIVPLSIRDVMNHFQVQVKYSFSTEIGGSKQVSTYSYNKLTEATTVQIGPVLFAEKII